MFRKVNQVLSSPQSVYSPNFVKNHQ